jgi:hypothetical protein
MCAWDACSNGDIFFIFSQNLENYVYSKPGLYIRGRGRLRTLFTSVFDPPKYENRVKMSGARNFFQFFGAVRPAVPSWY